jgi:hypothetical protein
MYFWESDSTIKFRRIELKRTLLSKTVDILAIPKTDIDIYSIYRSIDDENLLYTYGIISRAEKDTKQLGYLHTFSLYDFIEMTIIDPIQKSYLFIIIVNLLSYKICEWQVRNSVNPYMFTPKFVPFDFYFAKECLDELIIFLAEEKMSLKILFDFRDIEDDAFPQAYKVLALGLIMEALELIDVFKEYQNLYIKIILPFFFWRKILADTELSAKYKFSKSKLIRFIP